MTVSVAEPLLPDASNAVTVIKLVSGRHVIPLADQLVEPEAEPLPPRLLAHVTFTTPESSDAVPAISTVPVVVEYP